MRLSAKGRYALAATIRMAENYESGRRITVLELSERLGISKIYLEQVFSMLKLGDIVISTKGAQGGYVLSRHPNKITALDILSCIETALFDQSESTVGDNAPDIERAIISSIYQPLDTQINNILRAITLEQLTTDAQKNRDGHMFYI
ncbi:MAG: Rrf2 family transcriptional regulator [Clostridiales bacterium]|jgi:Rrf2 family protein|nr:Rrf2 family transcriptional regulator [Clostridiales bacterium]